MKTLIPSVILFLTVLAFIVTNTILLQSLFSDIEESLSYLPDTNDKISEMKAQDVEKYAKKLDDVSEKWKKWETYIYVTLEHDVSGEFYDNFLPAMKYFDSGDYPSYLSYLSTSKDILKQIKMNESFSFGTVF